tara:strand:+ start:897 stop:1052 length:156 start_codon:yes stop_codon:yes gene_type:complete
MAKPNAMNITKTPLKMNKKVFNTNAVSADTSALATPEKSKAGIKKVNIFFI